MGSRASLSAYIVWSIAAGFLSGVLIRSFNDTGWPVSIAVALLGALALYAYAIHGRSRLVIAGIALISCSLGLMRMDFAALVPEPELSNRIGQTVTIGGYIFDEPDVRERGVRVHVAARDLHVGSTTVPIDAKILAVVPAHSEVSYGDIIKITGELERPERFDTGAGRVFDYPMFLAKDGILYQLGFAQVAVSGENAGNIFKKSAIYIKHLYLSGLRRVLPEPEAGLAGGITVGDKRSIGEDLSDSFQKVSLIHIVVLSGYNMTVVMNAAAHTLSFVPRYAQFATSGVIVALFVLMTGGAASATRAGSMALIASYARLSGRSYIALRALAAVAVVMTLWNPYLLAFDPGFQLSILATLGLVLFTPIVSERIMFITDRFQLREIVASTIGTQIAVLPLLLYQNGLLSFVAIPANLLTLVFVPVAMLASFLSAIAGLIFGAWGAIIALPALMLLKYIIAVAELLAALPFASATFPAFDAWIMMLAYVLLAIGYIRIQKKSLGTLSPSEVQKQDT